MDVQKIKIDKSDFAEIINDVKHGKLRIPRFQREFVWERAKVIKLLESIYHEFPIGSFFIWEAPRKYNQFYRDIPELDLEKPDDTQEIKFILDGQQRITSLYVTMQGLSINGTNYGEISFDLDTEKFLMHPGDRQRFVPLHVLLGIEKKSDAFKIFSRLSEERQKAFLKCQDRFTKYPISIIVVRDKNLEEVCDIFERINQGGKRLNIFDLVVASTWSEDFELKDEINELNETLKGSFGEIDYEAVTETLSLISKKQCTRAYQLQLTTDDIVNIWDETVDAIKKAIHFLSYNLGVKKYTFLPYRDIIPMIAYFYYNSPSMTEPQKNKVEEWFWKVALSERYSSSTFTRMGEDRVIFDEILDEQDVDIAYPVMISKDKIKSVRMGRATALRNALICILATKGPKNFRDNTQIPLDRDVFSEFKNSEKHHIFPKSYLKKNKIEGENFFLNFCFIPADLNKEISGKKPSEYMAGYKKMNGSFDEALATHLVPVQENAAVWGDDYPKFLNDRASLFLKEIEKVVGKITKLEIELESNPNKVIDELESHLRSKVNSALYEAFGNEYWGETIPQDVRDLVIKRIQEKRKKQPYLTDEDFDDAIEKLNYCDVMDYPKIILKNWSAFEPIFGSKEQLDKHFKNFKEYRNSVKHSREMGSVERKEGEASVEWLMKSISDKKIEITEDPRDDDEDNASNEYTNILYEKFKQGVLSIGPKILVNTKKHYIAFKKVKNFTSLKIQNNRLKVLMRMPKEKFQDPKGIAKDVSQIGHHGTGDYELLINSASDIDYALSLVRQAYDCDGIRALYDVGHHLAKIEDAHLLEMVNKMREYTLGLDKRVNEYYTKHSIKFNMGNRFCSIYPSKNGAQIWLNLQLNKNEVTNTGLDVRPRKDEVWTHLRINSSSNIQSVKDLIKKAYEKNCVTVEQEERISADT